MPASKLVLARACCKNSAAITLPRMKKIRELNPACACMFRSGPIYLKSRYACVLSLSIIFSSATITHKMSLAASINVPAARTAAPKASRCVQLSRRTAMAPCRASQEAGSHSKLQKSVAGISVALAFAVSSPTCACRWARNHSNIPTILL